MRISLNIDDALVQQVMHYTKSPNRSEAIRVALKAYVRRQELEQILAMRGTIEFDSDLAALRALDTLPL